MSKCMLCKSRNTDRECSIYGNICSRCCGEKRSWITCSTICKNFKKEKYPGLNFKVYELSLKNESSGEIIKGKENCFLPNVYEIVNCVVPNLTLRFINSHTLEIEISFILESPRNIVEEIYLKDDWKNEETWGPYVDLNVLNPLLFVFGGLNSQFFPLKTSVNIDGQNVNFKESHVHWNIGMPFATIEVKRQPFFDHEGKKINITQLISGNAFSGHNKTIFSQLALNKPIKIKTYLSYQELFFDKDKMELKFPLRILIPFKNIKFENIEIIPPVDFNSEYPTIELLRPIKSIQLDRSPITHQIPNKVIHGKKEIIKFSPELYLDDYKLFKIDFSLIPKAKCEAIAFVTSYPLPSSIYNNINKLYKEKFAPAKVIISNFSDSTMKSSVISKIQGVSNSFEKDVIIGPFKQEEVRITPILNQNEVMKLHSPLDTSLEIKIVSNGEVILRTNEHLEILAKDTMIWEIEDPGRTWSIDLGDLVISWITSGIPEVSDIISKAARIVGSLGSFRNDSEMLNEVKAIYDIISGDIRYVNRAFAYGGDNTVITQRVLSPKQTLDGKSGNCIDLSVLFASCLESIGINPIIILTKDHAFVGWEGFSSDNFLEATFLGRYDFDAAMETGNRQYEEFSKKPNQPGKRRVDVKKVRSKGIYPPQWF